jgi:hypothetical protein
MPFALGAQDPAVKHAALIQAVAKALGADPADVLEVALDADPTRRDYVGWILKQMKFTNIILPEDGSRVLEALATLEEAKRVRYRGVEFDINKYKTIGDLEVVTDRIIDAESGRERAKPRQIKELPAGVTLYAESENYRILEVTDPDACVLLSRGTKWCTRESGTAAEYIKEHGKLYVIMALDGDQWVVYSQYTPDYDQIKDTKNKNMGFYTSDQELIAVMKPDLDAPDAAPRASAYAIKVIEGRWPEGEPVIAQDPVAAQRYASYALYNRWPEGESVIAQDPELAYKYAKDAIKGRFPEGEPAIARDPNWATWYAHGVIRGRFPKGEPAIAQDPKYAYLYALYVIRGRWQEGEPVIAQDPEQAFYYARDVIKGRFPEAEPVIAKIPKLARHYIEDVPQDR